jgi:hypothetical protein
VLPRKGKGVRGPMQPTGIDLLARALALPRSRRWALVAAVAVLFRAEVHEGRTQRRKRDSAQRGASGGSAFSRKCRRFIITAGPSRDDRFQHTDDDLLIEVIPKGGGAAKVVFEDDNDRPNGDSGEHLRVAPFTARVGDQVRIVARNEVAGGCELDEIWLHCIEGRGGKVQLTDRILPEDCRPDANRIGVFFESTLRITNK